MERAACTSGIVVLGVGNLLLTDDGVGVHALRAFQPVAPPGVVTADIGTAILHAEYLVESAEKLLVFDAMCAGGEPGTVYATYLSEVERRPIGDSLHNLTLKSFPHPPDAIVIAAEPGLIDASIELTPELQAAVPQMVSAALEVVKRWQLGQEVSLEQVLTGDLFKCV